MRFLHYALTTLRQEKRSRLCVLAVSVVVALWMISTMWSMWVVPGASNLAELSSWNRIANGNLADAWMEHKVYRIESTDIGLLHVRIRNKTSHDIGIVPHTQLCSGYSSATPFPISLFDDLAAAALDGPVDNCNASNDLVSSFKSGNLTIVHSGQTYDYYDRINDSYDKLNAMSKATILMKLSIKLDGYLSCTDGETVDRIRPECKSILASVEGDRIEPKAFAAQEELKNIEQALSSGCFGHTQAPTKNNWQCIKEGVMADIYVENDIYASKYLNSALVHIGIRNKHNKPLILRTTKGLFFPCQWRATDTPDQDVENLRHNPLYLSSKHLASGLITTDGVIGDDHQKKLVEIASGDTYTYFAAYPGGCALEQCSEKYSLFNMTGYCVLQAPEKAEVLSLSFDDHKEFKRPVVKINMTKPLAPPMSKSVLHDGRFFALNTCRQRVIDDLFEVRKDNAFRTIALGQQEGNIDLAEYYFAKRQYDQANLYNEKFLQYQPTSANVAEMRGRILTAQGKYNEALVELAKSGGTEYHQAYAYFKMKDYGNALCKINRDLQIPNDNKSAYLLRGQIYEATNQFQLAVNDYHKAIETEGRQGALDDYEKDNRYTSADDEKKILRNAEAYFRAASALRKLGRQNEAALSEKLALDLGYTEGMNSCGQALYAP